MSNVLDEMEAEWQALIDDVNETLSAVEGELAQQVSTDNSWLEGLHNSPAFSRLSADKIASMILRLEEFPVKIGDVVVRQKEVGDYFYVIKSGKFTVSASTSPGNVEILAQLAENDSFGESALISGEPRNASVFADTDGVLLRLSKADFQDLITNASVDYVSASEARELLDQGGVCLDVRKNGADKVGKFPGALEMPVNRLRERFSELEKNRKYIVFCQDGNHSELAAYLLGQKGFDVVVVKGGLAELSSAA
jgi:rhodanese-related sulfurtransferase